MLDNREPPKVFISYSWTSEEHQHWVEELSQRLANDGVHVIVDFWDLRPGQDKHAFMEKMVTDATIKKVLIASDQRYAEKADKREGGVGSESQIISAELYGKVAQEKFVPILAQLDSEGKPYLPVYLRGCIYIDLSSKKNYADEYEKLLRNVFDRPSRARPQIGERPDFLDQPNPLPASIKFQRETVVNRIEQGNREAQGHLRRFLTTCVSSLEVFRITEKPPDPLDETIVQQIRAMTPLRDELLQVFETVCTFSTELTFYKEFHAFLQNAAPFLFRSKNLNSWSEAWLDHYRFFLHELFLYFTALLIKHERYEQLNILAETEYCYTTPDRIEYDNFAVFDSRMESLDGLRNKRLALNRISLVADMLKERSPTGGVEFDALIEADVILTLKQTINDIPGISGNWWPITAVYTIRREQPLRIFSRFATGRNSEAIGKLFNASTPTEFRSKLDKAFERYHLSDWRFNYRAIQFHTLTGVASLHTGK